MKVALITSDQDRHKYLASLLFKEFGSNFVGIVAQNLNFSKKGVKKNFLFVLRILYQLCVMMVKKIREAVIPSKKFFWVDDHRPSFPDQVPINITSDINQADTVEFLKKCNPDVVLVFGGKILKEEILKIPRYIINLHCGFCPLYKGAGNSITAAGREDYRHMAATIHFVNAGIDSGDIISYAFPKYELSDNCDDVYCKTILAGVDELLKVAKDMMCGRPIIRVPQPQLGTTYFSKNEERKSLERRGKRNIKKRFKRFLVYTNQVILPYLSFLKIFIKLSDVINSRFGRDDFKDGVYIFLYHHVSRNLLADYGVYGSLGLEKMSTSEENFNNHILFLHKHFTFISLDTAVEFLKNNDGKVKGRYAVITFDDGYKSVKDVAFPILRCFGIQPAVFVNGLPLVEGKGLSRLRLSILLGRKENIVVERFDSKFSKNFLTGLQVFAEFKDNFSQIYEDFVNDIWDELADPTTKDCEKDFYLNWKDIAELRSAGVTIGSHTYSHAVLSKLKIDKQVGEIVDWHKKLENILGEKINYFAYPFGGVTHYNAYSELIVMGLPDVCAFSAYGFLNNYFYPTNILRIGVNNQKINQLRVIIKRAE